MHIFSSKERRIISILYELIIYHAFIKRCRLHVDIDHYISILHGKGLDQTYI